MKQIKLMNCNLYALCDDEDFDWLNRYNWYLTKTTTCCYAATKINNVSVYMHQLVLPSPSPKLTQDHKNINGLDNQKFNLRLATNCQQSQNRRKPKPVKAGSDYGTASKYKGVNYNRNTGGWSARIVVNKKTISLGTYNTDIEAAEAYNRGAVKYFGEFAKLNVIEINNRPQEIKKA